MSLPSAVPEKNRWRAVRALGPYIWPAGHPGLKRRVLISIGLLIMAGLALAAILPAGRLPDYRPGEIPDK